MKLVSTLSDSDRRALRILVLFFAGLLFYLLLSFSFQYREEAISVMQSNRQLLDSLQTHGQRVADVYVSNSRKVIAAKDQSLLAVASDTAAESGLVFRRFQPEGDSRLSIWLEEASFDSVLLWLGTIDVEYGIRVSQISVERSKGSGLVNVRVSLVRD